MSEWKRLIMYEASKGKNGSKIPAIKAYRNRWPFQWLRIHVRGFHYPSLLKAKIAVELYMVKTQTGYVEFKHTL